MEFFIAWYSGNPNEQFHFLNRAGPVLRAWIPMVTCNVLVPQLFGSGASAITSSLCSSCRSWLTSECGSNASSLLSSACTVISSPSNWGYYRPTWVDIGTYVGTFGLFFTMFLLFIRFPPMIAISKSKASHRNLTPPPAGRSQVKEVVPE
jgi:molybdopterin-containing oxidoreductase family membrane subunit